MNNDRRKAIKLLYPQCEELSKLAEAAKVAAEAYTALMSDLHADIESIRDEEQDYLDNMAENLRGSEKAEIAESAISALDEAMDLVDGVEVGEFDSESLVQHLDEATG